MMMMATFKIINIFPCFLLLIGIGINLNGVNGFFGRKIFPSQEPANKNLHLIDSKPLFLTPLIESNKINEARNLSKVKNLDVSIESYSGFFTVDKKYDSNMFFWFFPALSGKTDVPILLWLQGGPGGSSMFGLFVENGPLAIDSQGKASLRNHSWNENFALLYIDNPVGTGFSFTKNDAGYSNNEEEVAENLYKALEQFFTVFHEYQNQPFFLTGESYAGKYVPAIAYKIHSMRGKSNPNINLQGLAIGDGWCDPVNMFDYGQYLYQVGLIDEMQRQHFLEEQKKAEIAVKNRQFKKAQDIFDNLLDGDFTNQSYFKNVTGLNFYFNFLMDDSPPDFDYYIKYLAQPKTRESIHVGNLPYDDESSKVEEHLINDIMNSVKPWIEKLLDANYRIMFYSGQLDIIVAAPLTERFLGKLHWRGSEKYKTAPRIIYKVDANDNKVAGYVRQAGNMYQVIIRNAGHILPYDQPIVAKDMIERFVRNKPFTN